MIDGRDELLRRIVELEEENRRLRAGTDPVAAGLPSKQILDALFESSSIGVCILERNGDFVYRSPRIAEFTGLSDAESQNIFFNLHLATISQEERERIQARWRGFLETGEPNHHLFAFSSPQGVRRSTQVHLSSLGEFILMHMVDISDLTAIQEALLASSERYRSLVDNLGIGVYSLSDPMKGTFGSVNPTFARIFGYDSVDEVMALGSATIAYENPEDRTRFIQTLLDNEFQRSNTITFNARLLKKDRTPFWTRIVAHGTFDEHNRILRVDGVVEDITGRKMAEEALRESEQRFRQIFETAEVGIVVTSPDGRVVQANPAFCRFLGYSQEELRSIRAVDLTHPDHVAETIAQTAMIAVPGGGALHMEKRYLRKDGAPVWGQTSATDLFDEDGQKISGIAIVQDINQRRLMETDLLRMQKLESLSVLAGGIAHDFNNILTGVLGNVSLARTFARDDERQSARLARAEGAAIRARDLTLQLQTFARGGEPDRRVGYLEDIVREAAEFSLRGSKVRCDIVTAADPWPVEIDSGQMGQVISNLLINAQQSMPDGGTVEVRTETVELDGDTPLPLPAGRYVRLVVADMGVGIPEGDLGRIFDPYFTTKATGSGLGLATAYSIICKHDGYISVDSTVGVGTRFTVHLPASSGRAEPGENPSGGGLPHGTGRILLMDDEAIVLETLTAILEEHGYEVSCVGDGAEVLPAVRAAREAGWPFALVIMDLTVPGGQGGADVIDELRRYDPALRALVSSGYSAAPVMAEYREWGFQAALAKPHSAAELLAAVQRALAGE
ncbi:MAG: PAS domain S-box protein [Pseudomonadota bacterium]